MASSRRRTERRLRALISSVFVTFATGLMLSGLLSGSLSLAQAPSPPAAQPPTPRAPDGKPDLTGIWIPAARGGGASRYNEQGGETVFAARDNSFENFENDNALRRLGRLRNQAAGLEGVERDADAVLWNTQCNQFARIHGRFLLICMKEAL